MAVRLPKSLRDFQPKVACGASTATRLCNEAQGWTEGTTLGDRAAVPLNPNGVVTQLAGKQAACDPPPATTPLGLKFSPALRLIPRRRDRAPAEARSLNQGRLLCPTGETYC